MKKKKRRLSLRLNQLTLILPILLIAFNSHAQLKITDDVLLKAYKYSDIPYMIYFVNFSNSGGSELTKIKEILFITQSEQASEKIFPFYISSSLYKIPSKTNDAEGIIAFRCNFTDFIMQSSLNNSKMASGLIIQKEFKNYKEEAYALALILALENYKTGDTLLSYYYRTYYKNITPDMKLQEDSYLKDYLDGALIRAKHIYENQKEDLSIPEIKEITNYYSESRNRGNNDTIFLRSLRSYYINLARYYAKFEEKDYETIAGYYFNAMDIEINGETFLIPDLFNFANALFYMEQDNWAEDRMFDFGNCRRFYETLMKNKFRLCEVYLKLGAIHSMENYSKGDFSESKKYFKMVIDNNCPEQIEKAKKNLNNIKELENK
jgi:hypothetical protein